MSAFEDFLSKLPELAGKKFIYAISATVGLGAIAVYSLHVHEPNTALACVTAIGALGPIFLGTQMSHDKAAINAAAQGTLPPEGPKPQ